MRKITAALVAVGTTVSLAACVPPVEPANKPQPSETTKPEPPTPPGVIPPPQQPPSPTFTYTIVNTGGDNVKRRSAPAVGAAWNGLAPPNATVAVICQQFVSSEPMGSFGNTLWFKVDGAGLNGWWINDTFTNSPHLAADKTVGVPGMPGCATPPPSATAADRAVNEALARVGQTHASAGDQSLFAPSEWAPGPVAEWAGDCPKLPYAAWYWATGGAVRIQKVNAINNYNFYAARGLIQQGVPPKGAVTFYAATPGNSLGHTALSIGNAQVATTVGFDGEGRANTVTGYLAASSGTYLGYYLPG